MNLEELWMYICGRMPVGNQWTFSQTDAGSRVYIGVYRICADCIEPADIDGDHISEEGPKAFKISKNTLISCALLGLVTQALYN